MAKIRKRSWNNKDGSKSCTWQLDYEDCFGERKRHGSFKTKADAENALTKILSSINDGSYVIQNNKTTFEEAAQLYIELHVEVYCKPSTTDGYKGYLKNHILPYLGQMRLIDISHMIIQRFVMLKVKEGLSNQTINHLIILMGAIFNKMVDDNVIAKNPVAKIKKLKLVSKEMRFLETTEIHAVLNTAKAYYPDFYPLLFTAIFTGMRQGELLGLKWDKINWQTGKIFVNESFHKGHLSTPKTQNSIRRIDMSKELIKILKEWKLRCSHSDKNLVFPNQNGSYIDANNMIKRQYIPVLRKAGVEKTRFHDLRHSFASLLIAQNIPIKYIQSQMGHSSIQVTMDRYGHLLPEVYEKGVNALDSLFISDNLSTRNYASI